MAMGGKVVITCAVTGSIHTPTMSSYLPLTPDETPATQSPQPRRVAAIPDLHARDPKDGRPTPDPDVFMQFLPRIKQATKGAVVNITTGGGHGTSLDERLNALLRAKPEMCSLNMGSMNFGLYPMLSRYRNWQHPWEPQHLEMTRDFIFRNTFADIERILEVDWAKAAAHASNSNAHDARAFHLYNFGPPFPSPDRPGAGWPPFVQDDFRHLGRIGA